MFDSRAEWTQQKIDDLGDLVYSLFKDRNDDSYNKLLNSISEIVNNLNAQPIDYSDNSIFNQIKSYFKSFDKSVYSLYDQLEK